MNNQEQLGLLFWQLREQLTHEQRNTMLDAIAALQHAKSILYELQKADTIIHNCINIMTDEERLKVAHQNQCDGLSTQWAFRSTERQEIIQRAKRLAGAA